MTTSQQLKEVGNNHFKNKEYKEAIASYGKAINLLEDQHSNDASVLHSNSALCYLNLQQYEKCVEAATSSLDITPNNTKALYRRSLAYEQLKKYESALKDMRELLRLEPNNKEGRAVLPRLVKALEDAMSGSSIEAVVDKIKEAKTADEQEKMTETLLMLLKDPDQAIEFQKTCGLDTLEGLLIKNPKSVLSPQVRKLLIQILGVLSQTPSICPFMLKSFDLEFLRNLLLDGDVDIQKVGLTVLSRNNIALVQFKDALEKNTMDSYRQVSIRTMSEAAVLKSQPLEVVKHSLMSMARLPWLSQDGVFFLRSGYVRQFLEVASTRFQSDFSLVSVVLARVFDAINQGTEAKNEVVPKSAEFIKEHLKGENLGEHIQAVTGLLCILMADNAVGVPVLLQDMLSVLTNLTSFPKNSDPRDQRTLLLLTTEIFAYAADHEEFQKMHSLPMEELEDLFKQMNTPDKPIQARVVSALAKLANASPEVRSYLMKDKAARALRITVSLLDYEDKEEDRQREYAEARSTKQWAVETLSFLTRIPEVKEQLVNEHESSLPLILSFTGSPNSKAPEKKMSFADFAVASVLYNLTYDPYMGMSKSDTELQEELDKLKKFAGEKARGKPHELDGKIYVENRCKKVVEYGATTALIHVSKDIGRLTEGMCDVLSHVFLNLTNIAANRGRIVKDGGLKVLVSLSQHGSQKGRVAAAHALAKIAITTNPHVAFNNGIEFSLIKAIMPLTHSESPLQQFEALLALTNIADMSEETRTAICKDNGNGLEWIEGLMLEDDIQIRRAACELLCNLLYCGHVCEIYRNPEKGPRRLKLWGIFVQSEDFATQRACGGALATLATDPEVAKLFEGQVEPRVFVDLVSSKNPELEHRGVVALEGMTKVPSYAKALIDQGVVAPLVPLTKSQNPAVAKGALKVLRRLQGGGKK